MKKNGSSFNWIYFFLVTVFFITSFFAWCPFAEALCLSPRVTIDPGSYDFGSVQVGSSQSQNFTVSYAAMNGGPCSGGPPSVSVAVISQFPAFSVTPRNFTLDDALTGGSSRTVTVRFSPNTESSFSGVINVVASSGPVQNGRASVVGVGYRPQPNINIGVTDVNFGEVLLNTTARRTFTISNEGDSTLTGGISIGGRFSVIPNSFNIGPGASSAFEVAFDPAGTRGSYSEVMTITSNDPDARSLPVSVVAIAVGVDLHTVVNPSSRFGNVPVNMERRANITIRNRSLPHSGTLVINEIQLEDGPAVRYTSPDTLSLAPGQRTTIEIIFQPPTRGHFSQVLTITTNSTNHTEYPGGVARFTVSGWGIAPALNINTSEIELGDVHLGQTGTYRFNIENDGDMLLEITGFNRPSHPTLEISPASVTLNEGEEQEFEVRFSPVEEIAFISAGEPFGRNRQLEFLSIQSNDPSLRNLTLPLTGRGVTPRIDSSETLDFGDVLINPQILSEAGETDIPLSITNTGDEPLQISNISSSHPAFVPLTTNLTVPPQSEGALPVRFRPTAMGDHAGTLRISSNDYYNPVHAVNVTGRGVSYLDLSIDAMEITQAIQTMDNSVSLIAGKPTVVRTYVDMSLWGRPDQRDLVRNVDGVLRVFVDGTEIPESPLQSLNGPFDALPVPDRNIAGQTLNFYLPAALTQCDSCGDSYEVEFEVEINPSSGARVSQLSERNYSNNFYAETVGFWKNYTPTIYYIPMSIHGELLPSIQKMIEGTGLFRKIFPVPSFNYVRRPPLSINRDVTIRNAKDFLSLLFFASHLGNVVPPDRTYGWWPEGYSVPQTEKRRFSGIAEDIPGRIAMGGGLENIGSAQVIFAHEIGHSYGLCHTHSVSSCPRGYTDDHLVSMGTITETGFDTDLLEALRPVSPNNYMACVNSNRRDCPGSGWIDFMSYPPRNNWSLSGPRYRSWIHPQRYSFLFRRLLSQWTDPANARGCGHLLACGGSQAVPSLLISGAITQEGDVELHPLYGTESIPDPVEEITDEPPFTLKALDESGDVLFEYPLHLSSGLTGFGPGAEEADSTFSIIVPDISGLQKIQIYEEEEVVAEQIRSGNAPTVSIVTPAGGESIDDILEVEWEADDLDDDFLYYSVLYSHDGGETFQTLAVDLYDPRFEYNTQNLPGSNSSAVIRVVATDGFNTTTADSNPFTVTTKPPEVVIVSPENGQTFFSGTTISLEAHVYDPEDGDLPQESIQWSSDLNGTLGEGSPFVVSLTAGHHIVSVTVEDSSGQTANHSIELFVVDGTQAPNADAGQDQMINEGEIVILDAAASDDPDGEALFFEWRQLDGPPVILDDVSSVSPTFTAPDVTGDTLFKFLVSAEDESGHVATDTVDIVVLNTLYPALELSTLEIDFGTVPVGSAATQTLTLSNTGSEELVVTDIVSPRPDFSVTPENFTLMPGGSTEIRVVFTPSQEASYESNLRVESNTVLGVDTMIWLSGQTPDPLEQFNDNSPGGSFLLPPPPVVNEVPGTGGDEGEGPSGGGNNGEDPLAGDEGIGDEDPASTPDPGSYRIAPVGGCSLVRYDE